MASIEKRGEYSYRITVSSGYDSKGKKVRKHKSVTLDPKLTPKQTEKELQKLAAEFERQVEYGQILDGGQMTLSEFVGRWLKDAENRLEKKTLHSYKVELNSKILPAIGHIKLEKLRPLHLQEFYANLLEDGIRQDGKPGGYSTRTIKYQHQILSSLLQSAVQWQLITSNPCSRVKPPKGKESDVEEVKNFSEEQTMRFLEAIENEASIEYQLLFNLAIYTGVRKGELLALTWDDIDLQSGTININKSYGYTPDDGVFRKPPKNKTSNRKISLPSNTCELLKKYKVWQLERKLMCGDSWNSGWENNKLIFTNWNGYNMDLHAPARYLKKFLENYNTRIMNDDKIVNDEKQKHLLPVISFHKLRHTSATLLIASNTDVRTVASRLGHSTPSVTLSIYAHALQSADKKAASTLENMLIKNKNNTNSKQA